MADAPEYYCLDFGELPDELYKPGVPLADWQKQLKTAGRDGFAPGTLCTIAPIRFGELLERLIVFPIYMILNAAPFVMPPLLWSCFGLRGCIIFVGCLFGAQWILTLRNPMGSKKSAPYVFTERHIQKYNSIKWVWPKALQPPNIPGPKIFCTIPHGLAPVGMVAYPGWSKLFGERGNRPTAAATVLKLPVISYFLKSIGYIPASAATIKKAINNQENVHLVLDGIAGMFQKGDKEELGFVKERKGIVKIALTTGAPLVPVYGFGHSALWRIIVDPLRILERISVSLGVSVTPFCGRPLGLLPFGPPSRTPVLMAFGEPVIVPKVESPSQEQIDEYHSKMMDSFTRAFETLTGANR